MIDLDDAPWRARLLDKLGLVADGFEKVPRDPGGKWCKGAQCQAGGSDVLGDLLNEPGKEPIKLNIIKGGMEGTGEIVPSVMLPTGEIVSQVEWDAAYTKLAGDAPAKLTPADKFQKGIITEAEFYSSMSPGQKAAYTKKQNLLKAEEEAHLQQQMNTTAMLEVKTGMPLSNANAMSDENVDLYISTYFPKKGPPAGASAAERHAFVKERNVKHMADQSLLVNDLGYTPGHPTGPVESRRAVLRETGMRRATGGPKHDKDVHEFLTDEQINGMDRAKLEGLVAHHSGGDMNTDNLSVESLRLHAKAQNLAYKDGVAELQKMGYADSQIPHSNLSTSNVIGGKATGFPAPHSGFGPSTSPHGPKVTVSVAPIPKPVIHIATPAAKPPEWESWGPGKKAAWTKKQNQIAGISTKIQTTIPHPAEWESWGPGKKAAWTKKHKVGGVVTTHGKLGEHTVVNGTHSDFTTIIESHPKPKSPPGGFTQAHTSYHHALNNADPEAKYAVDQYAGSTYIEMNQQLRYGTFPAYQGKVDNMKRAFNYAPMDQPDIVERGKSNSKTWKEKDWQVGGVYEDKGFWSSSTRRNTASSFGTEVYMRVNTNGVKGIPGNGGEAEWIYPPGTKFHVTAINDVVSTNQWDGTTTTRRYIEADMVP